jgi:quercetin dioxygenase-like cupin family protein
MDGIRIIDDIMSAPGVETLEGRIGPLLRAQYGACHYIDMPAGLYLEEHPHDTESLIYTVRGEWVLCSGGERHHMKPGSLYWFGANVPTGYEVPFPENAYILIFKTAPRESDEALVSHAERLARQCEEDHANGTPFLLRELPDDHPARVFAAALGYTAGDGANDR